MTDLGKVSHYLDMQVDIKLGKFENHTLSNNLSEKGNRADWLARLQASFYSYVAWDKKSSFSSEK